MARPAAIELASRHLDDVTARFAGAVLRARRQGALLAVLLIVAGACSGSPAAELTTSTSTPTATSTSLSTFTTVGQDTGSTTLGPDDRPAELVAPAQVTAPAPLLVLLHSYGSSPQEADGYFGATGQAAARGLYVLLPGGTSEPSGKRFWDATAACCNFTGTPVDDVGYLRDLIDETLAERPIDPTRVYVMGHSNGGFMSYRAACDLAGRVTAVAVVSGADAPAADDCAPSQPVSVLHVHGSADPLVSYTGGEFTAPFPGAVESVARWATRNGCDPVPAAGEPLDLESDIEGAETIVSAYQGCAEGVDVQLDTIEGGSHVPILIHDSVGSQVFDWLLAHSR